MLHKCRLKNVPQFNYSTNVWFLSTVTDAKWVFMLLKHVNIRYYRHLCPCYWLVRCFQMCSLQGCQSRSDSIHIFKSILPPEVGTGQWFHDNDPSRVCWAKILNNLECGTSKGRILRNESLFPHPLWLFSGQPLSANFKFLLLQTKVGQIFLMWSSLMRRHVSDHLLWSVFQSSVLHITI